MIKSGLVRVDELFFGLPYFSIDKTKARIIFLTEGENNRIRIPES
jgi:hypothetical protein